ncbi:MAG: acyl-CoA synthetase [Pseudomonadota bacterium]
MHPSSYATTHPDRAAYVMAGSGETISYRQLDDRSNQGAQLFRSLGLETGDVIAVLLENHPRYFEIAWAAQRSGLYFTCISSKLNADEARYIVEDSGAKLLVTSPAMGAVAAQLADQLEGVKLYMTDAAGPGYESWDAAVAAQPAARIADESSGTDMLYSSGTTGRPKGIKPELTGDPIDAEPALVTLVRDLFGFPEGCVYLSPAPLYHSAPLRWCMAVHRLGGTVVVMEKFDPETALALIERYRVTCAQFVPTHFVRMQKLPEETRRRYDVSSLESVVHAAAPCPIPVKEAMIEWWGPIIHEYYAGTEGNGLCHITSEEWLNHKGSVGRAVLGVLHICDDEGEPVPPGTEGLIYFEGGPPVRYHNDPEKTADSYNRYGWSTLGDVGWVDEDGYLYLTDRKSFMIISGGVNIYPQEIENHLINHPKVADVAVVGAPDPEMGEQVVAVVQPAEGVSPGDGLAEEIIGYAREGLSHVKVPRRVDFRDELPRHATGKLYKRLIRDEYWGKSGSKIIES